MANIFTNLNLTADSNFFITQKINSIGYVGENTVTRLNIEVPEITEGANYELETENSAGEKNVALLSVDAENNNLYLDFTARMLTVNDLIMMQLRVTYADNSIKKSNRFAMKIAKSISATDYYEEYAVSIFDQLVNECRDIIDGAESYAVRAETAAVNAEAYEQSASASASTASTASETAQTASTAAVNAATSAETSANTASTSAETATNAANSASTSASTAQTSAQTAQSASVTAQSASEAAQTASTTATSAATSAENSATSATTAASNASASATSASTSASNAATSETNASNSATAAATSETNAANSATSASTSATNAANSATSAATSATNAHNSEVNASTSETNASTSATEAAASAESIAASVAQINENTYRINDLEAIIAGYQLTDLPTGAVASVTDGTALLMPSLKVGIEPVQSGSGDPSPENIRPISGWTVANISVSPTTSAEDGNTYTIEFRDGDNPLTVYGGTLDVTSGELVVDRVYKEFDGTENWGRYSTSEINTSFYLYSSISNAASYARQISNQLNFNIQAYDVASDRKYTFAVEPTNGRRVFIQVPTSLASTNEAFKAWLATQKTNGTPVAISVTITPITYHLTPTQIRTLVGNNNIWSDTGDIIEGKYFKSLS